MTNPTTAEKVRIALEWLDTKVAHDVHPNYDTLHEYIFTLTAELASLRRERDGLLGLIREVIADANWRTDNNTLWPRLVDTARGAGNGRGNEDHHEGSDGARNRQIHMRQMRLRI